MKILPLIAALLFTPVAFSQVSMGGNVVVGMPGPAGPAGAPGPNCSLSSPPGTCDLGNNTLLAGGVAVGTTPLPVFAPVGSIGGDCSFLALKGDTRCYTGANMGARIASCLTLKSTCDASSESLNLTISSTVNIGAAQHIILPSSTTITCSVAPCFLANNVSGWSVESVTAPGSSNTIIAQSVHGPVFITKGTSGKFKISHLQFDYSALNAGPSANPDDKAVVFTNGTGGQPQNVLIDDIYLSNVYDGVWDGSYTSSCCGVWTATNSNIVTLSNLWAQTIGDGVVVIGSGGSGVHDQYNITNTGCNGSVVASGLGCIYVRTANNLMLNQVWAWHLNDSGAGTGGSPLGFSAIRLDGDRTCNINSVDLEANHPIGSSSLLLFNNSQCMLNNFANFANVWGGDSVSNYNQQYIRSENSSNVVIGGGINLNALGSDTCSNTLGGTVNDTALDASSPLLYLSGQFSALPAMPSGTGCAPSVLQSRTGAMDQPFLAAVAGHYTLNGILGVTGLDPGVVQVLQTQGSNPPVNGYEWAFTNASTSNVVAQINGQTIGVTGLPAGEPCSIYYRPSGAGAGPTATYTAMAMCSNPSLGDADWELWFSHVALIGSESYTKAATFDHSGNLVLIGALTATNSNPTSSASGNIPKFNNTTGGTTDSGKGLAGTGAGIATGPTSGTTANNAACFADTAGTLKDCGAPLPGGGVVGSNDQTGLTAGLGATTVYTLGSSPAFTYFEVCVNEIETTAAGVSSTLPTPQVKWTATDTAAVTTQSVTQAQTTATANTVGTVMSGCTQIHPQASTAIQVLNGGYASSAAAAMTYAIHTTVIALR